jgi:hypothetical protein
MDSDNKKITQLTSGVPVNTDIAPYISSPGSTPASKYSTIIDFINGGVEADTWTPSDVSGAGLVFTNVTATYTKIGRLVVMFLSLIFPATANAANVKIGGFPYAAGNYGPNSVTGFITATTATITARGLYASGGANYVSIDKNNATTAATNADFSGCVLYCVIILQT